MNIKEEKKREKKIDLTLKEANRKKEYKNKKEYKIQTICTIDLQRNKPRIYEYDFSPPTSTTTNPPAITPHRLARFGYRVFYF